MFLLRRLMERLVRTFVAKQEESMIDEAALLKEVWAKECRPTPIVTWVDFKRNNAAVNQYFSRAS